MEDRGKALGMSSTQIVSADPVIIYDELGKSIQQVRESSAPLWCVVDTYRLSSHSKGDDTRDPEEVERNRNRDPIRILRANMDADQADTLDAKARTSIEEMVNEVSAAPLTSDPTLVTDTQTLVDGDVPWHAPFVVDPAPFVTRLNAGLTELLEEHQSAFFMGEDILDPYGGAFKVAKGLSTRFPERTLTTPISEAGITAWGIGAALTGARPVVEMMFGDFTALTADQILNHAAKYRWLAQGEASASIVIRTPMGGRRGYGPTHSQSIEAMFLGIPELVMVAPTHLLDPGALLKRASAIELPVMFVENKGMYAQQLALHSEGRIDDFSVRTTETCFPTLHLSLAEFETPDVVIVTYGGSVELAMEAASQSMLKEERLVDILVVTSLSPLPTTDLRNDRKL